jgi:hypothetical protein
MYSPLRTEVDLEYLRHQRRQQAEIERTIRSVDNNSALETMSLSFSKFVRLLEARLQRTPVEQTNAQIRLRDSKQSQFSS